MAVVLRAKVSVQLVFFSLDVEVKVHHGFRYVLTGVIEDLDQLPRPQLVALLEEGVSRPLPARPASPTDPDTNNLNVLKISYFPLF